MVRSGLHGKCQTDTFEFDTSQAKASVLLNQVKTMWYVILLVRAAKAED